jgi:membrane protease YdiL (CAAX protease family)
LTGNSLASQSQSVIAPTAGGQPRPIHLRLGAFMRRHTLAALCLAAASAGLVGAVYGLMVDQTYNAALLAYTALRAAVASLLLCLVTAGVRQPTFAPEAPRQLLLVGSYVALLVAIAITLEDGASATREPLEPWVEAQAALVGWLWKGWFPLLFVIVGFWRWPPPGERLGSLRIVLAILVIIAFTLTGGSLEAEMIQDPAWRVARRVLHWLVHAAAEELVYRVMLLTYLASVLRSPTAALVLSSIVFGAIHLPGAIDDQTLDGWWRSADVTVWPLAASIIGFFLGAIWLRTRSFVLVTAAHALSNLFAPEYEIWPPAG